MYRTGMDPMRRVRLMSNAVLARLGAVGADSRDDEQTRQGKSLLVLTSVLILPIAVVWGSLYLIFGSPVGYVPFVYALVLLGAIIAFAAAVVSLVLIRERDFVALEESDQSTETELAIAA